MYRSLVDRQAPRLRCEIAVIPSRITLLRITRAGIQFVTAPMGTDAVPSFRITSCMKAARIASLKVRKINRIMDQLPTSAFPRVTISGRSFLRYLDDLSVFLREEAFKIAML